MSLEDSVKAQVVVVLGLRSMRQFTVPNNLVSCFRMMGRGCVSAKFEPLRSTRRLVFPSFFLVTMIRLAHSQASMRSRMCGYSSFANSVETSSRTEKDRRLRR